MDKICPMISNGKDKEKCLQADCALWVCMDIGKDSRHDSVQGCAFTITAEGIFELKFKNDETT